MKVSFEERRVKLLKVQSGLAVFKVGDHTVSLDKHCSELFYDQNISGLKEMYDFWNGQAMDEVNSMRIKWGKPMLVNDYVMNELLAKEPKFYTGDYAAALENVVEMIKSSMDLMLAIQAAIWVLEKDEVLILNVRREVSAAYTPEKSQES